jgi:ABC-type Fe3+/spermidine/putrescine transport system ATPase subunit
MIEQAALRHAASGDGARTAKVSARGVSKRYGDFYANRDIDLDIRTGEFLTLLGPSGCGKSTLMRIIAGLETCDDGRIFIDGRDVTSEPPRRRGIGMVFQNYSLFPHMSVWENVAYGLKVKGLRRAEIAQRVEEMLALIRLPEIARRLPSALSGGQQQRVALARALATRPSLLMLDEPLGALDLKLRHQLQAELRRIHRETGVTFLFVTHDQEEALFLSDRVAVMRDGRIEQLDTPEAIYQRPINDYVADFIGDVTLIACERDASDHTVARFAGLAEAAPLKLAQPAPHAQFRLVVRPEQVHVATDRRAGIPVEIDEIINEGSTTLLLLRLASGALMKARLIGRPPGPWVRGTPLGATIDEDVVVLPAATQ